MTMVALAPQRRDLTDRLPDVLWRGFARPGDTRQGVAGRISDAIGCGIYTALGWLKGENLPSLEYAVALARVCPACADFLAAECRITTSLSPSLVAEMLELTEHAKHLHALAEAAR